MPERTSRPVVWYCPPHDIEHSDNVDDLAGAQMYGDLSAICPKYLSRLALPARIAAGLSASEADDTLLLSGDQYIDLLCCVIWFMYHKNLTVLIYEHDQFCGYTVSKDTLMSLVQHQHDRRKA